MAATEATPSGGVEQLVNSTLLVPPDIVHDHPFARDFRSDRFESAPVAFLGAASDRMRRSRLPQLLSRFNEKSFEEQLADTAHIGAELFLEVTLTPGLLRRSLIRELFSRTHKRSFLADERRFLYVPSDGYRQPVVLVLDPVFNRSPILLTATVSQEKFSRSALNEIARKIEQTNIPHDFLAAITQGGVDVLLDILDVSRPEIVVACKPRMERPCAPWPYVDVQCGEQLSTVGIFCRDEAGQLGVTACYHGTGEVGTAVQVGLGNFKVGAVNQVQDIVFVPIGNGYNIPSLRATAGMYPDRSPSVFETANFWGASSGQTETRIVSMDTYIFRHRASMQMKLQTLPNTNTGDSGAALISGDDHVLGFAFERTAFGEYPEMTDWIWASNALRALKLTPF